MIPGGPGAPDLTLHALVIIESIRAGDIIRDHTTLDTDWTSLLYSVYSMSHLPPEVWV